MSAFYGYLTILGQTRNGYYKSIRYVIKPSI